MNRERFRKQDDQMDLRIAVVVLSALLYSTHAAPPEILAPFGLTDSKIDEIVRMLQNLSITFHPNRVISLPGAPLLPEFNLFSGYLNGSSNATDVPIFYVLAEAIRVDPSTAPLVVWFNGGPGGSSLAGFFKEHGPYRVTEKGDVLSYNEFSWNQYANVLYLESPLGVGFSQNNDGNETMNDIDAANVNFYALKDLMTRVHPNYEDREYYLSGQSYAGAFVPYLARRILEGIESKEMENKNFKGFAIGNPVFDYLLMDLTIVLQWHSLGLIPSESFVDQAYLWRKYTAGQKLFEEELNILKNLKGEALQSTFQVNSAVHYNYVEHCYNNSYSAESYHISTDKKSISCYGNDALTSFLNRIDVQTALHVTNFSMGAKNWEPLNFKIGYGYTEDQNVIHVYDDIFELVNGSSFRVLIYHGDTDAMLSAVHSLNSTRTIALRNDLEEQKEVGKSWKFYGDFAGVRKGYKFEATTMDVITVRGAGHSVPTDLPAQAFQMINNFLFTEDDEDIDFSRPIRKH